MTCVAALFVARNGVYFGMPDVEPWDMEADARLYAGPYPVVAHPPCERWGRYWSGGPNLASPRKKLGADDGCFAAALAAVRRFDGVLEHPEASHAWTAFGLNKPPKDGRWVVADWQGGWTCCVEQGHYGHAARKAAWLYAVGCELPDLRWGSSGKRLTPRLVRFADPDHDGFHSAEERRRRIKTGVCQRLSKKQRAATPTPFRDLLIAMAQSSERRLSPRS